MRKYNSKGSSRIKKSKGDIVKSKGSSRMKMSKGNAVMKMSKGGPVSIAPGFANRRREDLS